MPFTIYVGLNYSVQIFLLGWLYAVWLVDADAIPNLCACVGV